MMLEVFPLGPFETNAILIACPRTLHAAVVDAPAGSADLLPKRIEELKLSAKMILLTHSHWDHTANAAALKEKLGVPLFVHIEDAGNLEEPGSDGLPLLFSLKAAQADGYLIDGQRLFLGELEMQVIHTPGHTPGGVCFYFEKEGILISGDTLFQGSIGNLHFPTARPALMGESLKRLATLPPDTKVYPGHGEPTTIKQEQGMMLQLAKTLSV